MRDDALHHAGALVAPRRNQRLDLVDENDAARLRGGGIEELFDVLLGLSHPLAQHVGGRDSEKGGVDLARRRLGEHRLAGPGRAVHQHAPAGPDVELGRQLRVLERVDHLQADVFLDVVKAGNVIEAQGRLFLDDPLVGRRSAFRFGRLFAGPAAAGAPRQRRLPAILLLRGVAVLRQVEQLLAHLAPRRAQVLALGRLAQLEHRPGRLEQVNPRRVPLPGPPGVEPLLLIALELVPGNGHGWILDF